MIGKIIQWLSVLLVLLVCVCGAGYAMYMVYKVWPLLFFAALCAMLLIGATTLFRGA